MIFFSETAVVVIQLVDTGGNVVLAIGVPRTPEWWDINFETRMVTNRKDIKFPVYSGERKALIVGVGVVFDGIPFGGGRVHRRPILEANDCSVFACGEFELDFVDEIGDLKLEDIDF